MSKELSAFEAKNQAQVLAFSPIFFQAIIALRDLGVLEYVSKKRKGAKISDIINDTDVSDYGVNLLLEAGKNTGLIEYLDKETVKITKIGFFVLKDEMTRVNFDFINDVCYDGAKFMTESIKNGKPEGLKTLGDWPTIYEGLSILPEPAKTSWFEFDHYYSDDAFPFALDIVFKDKPKQLYDIGGNTGKWTLACCNHDSDVNVTILDLPIQINVAKKNIEENGFSDRVNYHPINLLDTSQKIPAGCDAVWMSQFLDCFGVDEIVQILSNVAQAADENTNIFIMEPFFDNQKFESAEHSLVGTSLYFTIMANGNSKMYSIDVMKNLAKQAGLKLVEEFPLIGNSYHTILKLRKA